MSSDNAFSVIVPAHNEENVILRCLATLLKGLPQSAEVLVVCNGCEDKTAHIAGSIDDPRINVIDTDVPSKSNALNLGDEAASHFPRIYLDADVTVTGSDLSKVAQVLSNENVDCRAAAPAIRVDTSDRSWVVRAYYDIWTQLPYAKKSLIGSGIYALSEQGRSRFDRFPDITCDDDFVRLNFTQNERCIVEGTTFTVTPPTSLKGIILICTRSHFGNLELWQRYPKLLKNKSESTSNGLLQLMKSPYNLPKILVYMYVRVIARRRGHKKLKQKDFDTWERDDSSRMIS